MAKVDMKNTDYYKSGKMRQNALAGLEKGLKVWEEKARNRIEEYNLAPKLCIECKKPLSYPQRIYTFCSRKCGSIKANRERLDNGYKMSDQQRQALSIAAKKIQNEKSLPDREIYKINPKTCVQCSIPLEYEKRRSKTCSKECLRLVNKKSGQQGGLKSASGPRAKRSKNEILFAELCLQEFTKVTCNERIFDGWDADVLIYDHKIAVLWNGDWHYREMGCYNHSLSQVQNRDKFKAELIKKYGWLLYVVKDTTDHPTKPKDAVVQLKTWIESIGAA
jgi:predicted nucleic acid-binding Zn ribbon protein